MKKFCYKLLIFSSPALILILTVIYIDFFKVFGYQDYYSNQLVGLNREMITTKTFNHYREIEKYDSFIFGSSRSQAFKCKNWATYLDKNAKPFHFDASGEGIWGISKKMQYLDELGDTIKNALIIVDRTVLEITYPRDGHLFISLPCVSKASAVDYYLTFLKASLNPKFLVAYIDFSVFKTYRKYMGYLIKSNSYDHTVNNRNCDIWYGYDKEIATDSTGYYNFLINSGVFNSHTKSTGPELKVCSAEINQLEIMRDILKKHKSNYKIVISPVYDQIPMEPAHLKLLEQLFGKENIYNFSGKNAFTENIANYYESSHYKPCVANQILKIIYN